MKAISLWQPWATLWGHAASDDDRECGDFAPGRFAWKRDEFRLFDQPIPYRGAQGIFTVPDDLIPQDPATFSEESVPAKEKKTQDDLIALLMGELRKHPECDSVVRVTIIQPVQSAPHHPNWDVAWTVGGNQILCPAALRIASELQAKFDLA